MVEDNTPAAVQVDVLIDGEVWSEVKTFENCVPDDHSFMLGTNAGTVLFGDGKHGFRPPAGSKITANYQTGDGSVGNTLRFSWTVSDPRNHMALSTTITILPDSFRLNIYQGNVQSWRWKLVAWLSDALKARLLGSSLSKR